MKIRSSVQTLAALLVFGISNGALAQSADTSILGLADVRDITRDNGAPRPGTGTPKTCYDNGVPFPCP
jgi:hypothetical protein